MKILMLFPYAPLPPPLDLAGTKRNLPFALELAKHNEVSVLSFGTRDQEESVRRAYGHLFTEIRFIDRKRPRAITGLQRFWLLATGRSPFRQLYSSRMQHALDEITTATRYDLIHCCVQFFGYFRFPPGIPVSSDTHEVKYDLLRRTALTASGALSKLLPYLYYKLGKAEELQLCGRFDLLIATTEPDRQLFLRDIPRQKIEVIQNGAGYAFFEDLGIPQEPLTMVFTGLFTHQPNVQGIRWFLDQVFPLVLQAQPAARVFVVGKAPPSDVSARASANVIVTGFVDDVRPYMARAQVYIIPLLSGGGIRGKALEAMAMKRPIVTTTIGVEGIKLENQESALFADSPEGFAASILRLFADASLRERLAIKAFATARQHYDWAAKGRELDRALRATVVAKNAQPESSSRISERVPAGGM